MITLEVARAHVRDLHRQADRARDGRTLRPTRTLAWFRRSR